MCIITHHVKKKKYSKRKQISFSKCKHGFAKNDDKRAACNQCMTFSSSTEAFQNVWNGSLWKQHGIPDNITIKG